MSVTSALQALPFCATTVCVGAACVHTWRAKGTRKMQQGDIYPSGQGQDLWLAAPAPLKSSWLTLLASTPLLFGQSPLRKEF